MTLAEQALRSSFVSQRLRSFRTSQSLCLSSALLRCRRILNGKALVDSCALLTATLFAAKSISYTLNRWPLAACALTGMRTGWIYKKGVMTIQTQFNSSSCCRILGVWAKSVDDLHVKTLTHIHPALIVVISVRLKTASDIHTNVSECERPKSRSLRRRG